MADTFSKKAQQQKKAKKKQDKLERREERKTNNDKGKSLEEMTVYLDENGNFTDVHPDQQKKAVPSNKSTNTARGIQDDDTTYTGTIALFFPDKGYGFIAEDNSKVNIFVHQNKLRESVVEKDKVSFKKEKTPKGFSAYEVKKIK